MASATMNKGMTFFRYVGRQCEVTSADTVEQAAAAMRAVFDGPAHEVSFYVTRTDAAGVPAVKTQIANKLRKLGKIAAKAGRVVAHHEVRGSQVFCKVVL